MKIGFRTLLADPELLLATGFGSGLAPKAPGTAGSLLGLIIFIPVLALPVIVQLVLVILSALAGIWICDRVAARLAIKDPAFIVWDEFVGMWIAMLLIPSLLWLPIAFVLFRIFDVVKPWPVSWADRKLEGGLGIMLDDIIAGLLSLAVLQLLHFLHVSYF